MGSTDYRMLAGLTALLIGVMTFAPFVAGASPPAVQGAAHSYRGKPPQRIAPDFLNAGWNHAFGLMPLGFAVFATGTKTLMRFARVRADGR